MCPVFITHLLPFNYYNRYVWEINPPKDNDYMHFYNEIAVECFNHTFDKRYAEVAQQPYILFSQSLSSFLNKYIYYCY